MTDRSRQGTSRRKGRAPTATHCVSIYQASARIFADGTVELWWTYLNLGNHQIVCEYLGEATVPQDSLHRGAEGVLEAAHRKVVEVREQLGLW